MGYDMTLSEALRQAMKLEAAKAVAGPPAWLPVRRVVGTLAPTTESHRSGRPVYWQCENTGHLERGCLRGPAKEVTNNYNWRRNRAAGMTTDFTRQAPESTRTTPCATLLP
jgi:hypothetical protein